MFWYSRAPWQGAMGHTLFGFSQDRGSDSYQPLFLWLDSLIYSGGPSEVETQACVPSGPTPVKAAILSYLISI